MKISGVNEVSRGAVPVHGNDNARGAEHVSQAYAKHSAKNKVEEESPAVVVEKGKQVEPAPTYVEQLKKNQAAAVKDPSSPTTTVSTGKVEERAKAEQYSATKAKEEVESDLAATEELTKSLASTAAAKTESVESPVKAEKPKEKVVDKPADQKPVETVDPRWRRYQDAVEAADSSRHPATGQKRGESDVRAVRG